MVFINIKKHRFVDYIPPLIFVITFVFIAVKALEDAAASTATSGGLIKFLLDFEIFKQLNAKYEYFSSIVRKLFGHYLLYGFLGIFGYLSSRIFIESPTKATLISCAIGLFSAIACELLQFIPTGRAPLAVDAIINFQGYLTFSSAMAVGYALFDKNKPIKYDVFAFAILLLFAVSAVICFAFFSDATFDYVVCAACFSVALTACTSVYTIKKLFLLKNNRFQENP